jgi:cell division transport system permease protein
LLPHGDGGDRALVFVVATLCFLACLTVFAALAGDRAAQGWRGDLAASATVQVLPKGGESSSEAAARAAEALAAVKGVAEARVLDRAEAERLLEPWLGKGNIPDDLPLPLLVTLDLDPQAPATPAAMNAALAQAGVDARLDDHSRWMKAVEHAGLAVRAAALAACVLTGLAAAAVIAFATRAGLAARRDVVEVLHLTGARDRFVAGLFQRRFAALAARAGTYGALAAVALAALARAFGGQEGFTPVLPLSWTDLLAALPCPLLAAGVAAVAARRTALSILRAEP